MNNIENIATVSINKPNGETVTYSIKNFKTDEESLKEAIAIETSKKIVFSSSRQNIT